MSGCSACRPSHVDKAWAAPACGGCTPRPTPWPTWSCQHRRDPANASSAPSWLCWFSSVPASTVWPAKVGGDTQKKKVYPLQCKLLKAILWESLLMFWFRSWRLQVPLGCCSNLPVLYFKNRVIVLSLSKQSVHIEWRNVSNAKSQSQRKLDKVRERIVRIFFCVVFMITYLTITRQNLSWYLEITVKQL